MASIVIYGTKTANGTLTTACQMTLNTGGVETTSASIYPNTNPWGEVWSKGNAAAPSFTAIQSPTGNGWVYLPGAGTFATGNWSATVGQSDPTGPSTPLGVTLRFYKYTGSYVSIGSILLTGQTDNTTRGNWVFPGTSMATVTFAATDLLYIDIWYNNTTVHGDEPTVYLGTSGTAGLANDLQVTTSSFTASAGGPPFSRVVWSDCMLVGRIGGM